MPLVLDSCWRRYCPVVRTVVVLQLTLVVRVRNSEAVLGVVVAYLAVVLEVVVMQLVDLLVALPMIRRLCRWQVALRQQVSPWAFRGCQWVTQMCPS